MSIRSLLVALFLTPFAASAQDAEAPGSSDVNASLVAEQSAIVPGQKFTVGLQLTHKEHWHSFWRNGGSYSQPTRITWKLPDGITAADMLWPVPQPVPADGFDGEMQHIYEGTVHLLTEMTASSSLKPGDTLKLTARVDGQACTAGKCNPFRFDLTLDLPVAEKAEPVAASAAAFDAVRKSQPAPNASWKTSVTAQGESWIIRAEPGEGAAADPGTIYFLDAAAATEPVVQEWKQDGKARVLTIPAKETKPAGQKPWGLLLTDKSWVEGSEVKNIALGAPPPVSRSMPPAKPPGETNPSAETKPAGSANDDALIAQILSWGTVPLGGEGQKSGGLTWPLAIFFAFLGGMILNLMPCVFPVLGIKILSFVKQSGEDHASVKRHGLVYAGGVIMSLMLLAGLLVALRVAGKSVGWGFQLQNPWFLIGLITIVFGFSLSMAGVFEFGTKLTGVGNELQNQGGYRGSFFSGLLTVLLATPCTGPFMGPALGFALNDETPYWLVIVIFGALSIGLALPYVILSWFPALVKKLPRPGAWMETFKQFMAFPMFATAVWLVTVFAGSTGESGMAFILFALTMFAMALWLYGRFFQRPAKPRSKGIAAVVAILCLGSAGWLSAEAVQKKPAASGHGEIPLSPQLIVERREKGLTTVVDLWAIWCLQCELNRKAAFDRTEFRDALPKHDAIFMLGDKSTQDSPEDVLAQKFVEAFKTGGIPYAFIVPPKGPLIVLPNIIPSPDPVLEGLKQAQRQAKQ